MLGATYPTLTVTPSLSKMRLGQLAKTRSMGCVYEELKQESSHLRTSDSDPSRTSSLRLRCYMLVLLLVSNAITLLMTFTYRSTSYCPGDSPQGIGTFDTAIREFSHGVTDTSLASYMSDVDLGLHIATFNGLKKPNNYTSSTSALGSSLTDRWIDLGAYCRLSFSNVQRTFVESDLQIRQY